MYVELVTILIVFLNKFYLVEVLLRYAAENYRAVVEVRLNESKV